MKDKRDAEKTEAQLLETFDYAWNKGSNGARRPADILQKINRRASRTIRLPAIFEKLQISRQKRVGIKIEACKPLMLENASSTHTNQESYNLFSRILKFGRSRPRIVSVSFGVNEDYNKICGVALGHGSVCYRPPDEGRKRCTEHKGMKVNGSISKLITEGKSFVGGNVIANQNLYATCGVILNDSSSCRRQPLQGRKRCEEHKGRRVCGSISEPVREPNQRYVHGSFLESSTCHIENDTTCGVDLKDGTFCTRRPVVGRKRCEEHKGMRVKESISKSLAVEIPDPITSNDWISRSVSNRKIGNMDLTSTCGASLGDGSFCRRPPAEGRKRCWQHKGMRARSSVSYEPISSYEYEGKPSHICGAGLKNGSICRSMPVHGRKRCEQHKGMRAAC